MVHQGLDTSIFESDSLIVLGLTKLARLAGQQPQDLPVSAARAGIPSACHCTSLPCAGSGDQTQAFRLAQQALH